MNFEFMPELHTHFGYPIALLLMVLAGALPYIYFKWRRWL
jgi:magnesium transporter